MAGKTCFVVMPIGDQDYRDIRVSSTDLRKRYDDLIKEAILRAKPTLEVTRADDVSMPGAITTDIITRIMHSDYVVADVTYPNPNVFYELGLRHACRSGTIIIREKTGPKTPFDIAHLRHLEYENTPSGLKELSERIGQFFAHLERDPDKPDNHFLEIAKLTEYEFPDYGADEEDDPELNALLALAGSPEILDMLVRHSKGEQLDRGEVVSAIMKNPTVAQPVLKALIQSGVISLGNESAKQSVKPNRAARRKKKKK